MQKENTEIKVSVNLRAYLQCSIISIIRQKQKQIANKKERKKERKNILNSFVIDGTTPSFHFVFRLFYSKVFSVKAWLSKMDNADKFT